MDRRWGVGVAGLFLWMVVLGEMTEQALSVPNKCSACQVVAAEIESGLANERPRNHLDMRHRLDSKGQREGKVIDYKVSELRVVELLEGLCVKFKSYALKKGDTDSGEWIKLDTEMLSDLDRQEAEAYSKRLVSYCGRLMEATDDELTSKIQNGVIKTGDVEPVLCVELSGHCNLSQKEEENSKELVLAEVQGGSDGEL